MDIYDGLKKLMNSESSNEVEKYKESAISYSEQGFDEQMIQELLEVDGCTREASKKLAFAVTEELPSDYDSGPPRSYEDIKPKVEDSIRNASFESWEKYLSKIGKKYASLLKDIDLYRQRPTQIVADEIHKVLEPVLSNSLLMSKASSGTGTREISERENLERDLFGIWPVYLVDSFNQKIAGEKEVMSKSAQKQGGAPIIFN